MPEKSEKLSTNPVKYFLSGGFGGICNVLMGFPLDTIKVRLQTMSKPKPGEAPMYTGALDCTIKTVRREGFKGLYKGLVLPLLSVGPMMAMNFFVFELGKRLLQKGPEDNLTMWQVFSAGSFSSINTLILAPVERIKCLLQKQRDDTPEKYKGPVDAARTLYKEGGIRSVYKGTGATILRDTPSYGVFFLVYEMIHRGEEVGVFQTLLAGGVSGMSYWVVAMPIDVLKSRLQTAPEGKYNGLSDVFRTLMKEDGPRALYRGITTVWIRTFPANAACFYGFELSMKFLNWFSPDL